MELYLLNSGACLAIFFIFYKLFLEKENMPIFKRFYLLGMLIASFVIPLITFTTYTEASEAAYPLIITNSSDIIIAKTNLLQEYLPIILWSIYFIGLAFFSIRFTKNLFKIILKIKQNQKLKLSNYINVLLNEKVIPHTFFNYIFFNKQKFEAQEIPEEVLVHEQTHAKQKHSIDVLLIEFLQIIFWFNPFIYFIKHSIKLNHEFLADWAVLNKGAEPTQYQNIVLAFSSPDNNRYATTPQMANSINYSFIKKRFTVMKTHTSKTKIWIRSILLLPLLAVLVYGFSIKQTVDKEFLNNKISNIDDFYLKIDTEGNIHHKEKIIALNEIPKAVKTYIKEFPNEEIYFAKIDLENKSTLDELSPITKVIKESGIDKITACWIKKNTNSINNISNSEAKEGLTKEQLAEYNTLARKYNAQTNNNRTILKKDVERLYYLYDLMTAKQKKNAEPFPVFPPIPPLPPAPKAPRVIKGVNDTNTDIPPPPPAPKKENSKRDAIKINGTTYYYNTTNGLTKYYNRFGDEVTKKGEIIMSQSRPNNPPTLSPLPAPDPLANIIKLAKEGAHFYLYEEGPHFKDGREINSEKAINILRKYKNMTVTIRNDYDLYTIIEIRAPGC